jgi:hypothetical protein
MERATYLKLADKWRVHLHRGLTFRQRLLLTAAADAWTDAAEIEPDVDHEGPRESPASAKPASTKLH